MLKNKIWCTKFSSTFCMASADEKFLDSQECIQRIASSTIYTKYVVELPRPRTRDTHITSPAYIATPTCFCMIRLSRDPDITALWFHQIISEGWMVCWTRFITHFKLLSEVLSAFMQRPAENPSPHRHTSKCYFSTKSWKNLSANIVPTNLTLRRLRVWPTFVCLLWLR